MEQCRIEKRNDINRHFDLLDLFKGISAVLLVFHHYQQVFEVQFPKINFCTYDSNGFYFGYLVEFFFIVSGFVTWYSETYKRNFSTLFSSFIKRMKRIYPMAFLACAAHLTIERIYHFLFGEWTFSLWSVCGEWKVIVTSFLLLFRGWPGLGSIGINNPAWYCCILILCYVLFYLFSACSQKLRIDRKIIIILFLLVLDMLSYMHLLPEFIENDAIRGYRNFFEGVLIAELIDQFPHRAVFVVGSVLSAVFLLCLFFLRFFMKNQQLIVSFFAFPALVCFGYAFEDIKCACFRKVGKISFYVFLWHIPVFSTIKLICRLVGIELSKSYLTMLFVTGVAVFIATLIDHLVNVINRKRNSIVIVKK